MHSKLIKLIQHSILVSIFGLCLGIALPSQAANIQVNTLTDVVNGADGLCSLREAMTSSVTNIASGGVAGECPAGSILPVTDKIRFPALSGIILLGAANGPLPTLSEGGILIDGWSAAGAGPNLRPTIGIDGQMLGVDNGITLTSTKNRVRGLDIVNFGLNGVRIETSAATGNHVYGNVIGANPSGNTALGNENGVSIDGGASQNLIGTDGDGVRDGAERNIISGNLHTGVAITGTGTDLNVVAGNYIGTNSLGNNAQPNGVFGVSVGLSAADNIIGTDATGNAYDANEGNVISGNGQTGINQVNSNLIIAGNIIGLNAAGDTALPNQIGIQTLDGTAGNQIGTNGDGISDDFERNVISGNTVSGISLRGPDHQVAGNYIGTDLTGTIAIANPIGIEASLGPLGLTVNLTIGGKDERFRNVISGNSNTGVSITAADVTVECNYFGTDASGTLALANGTTGVNVTSGINALVQKNLFSFNPIGAVSSESSAVFYRNIIAGNTDGFQWSGTGVISLGKNWWGDATGPTLASNPGGLGDTILEIGGGTATYNPWLSSAPTLCAVTP